jgi:DNA-binding CsgD family transcriptional regulator
MPATHGKDRPAPTGELRAVAARVAAGDGCAAVVCGSPAQTAELVVATAREAASDGCRVVTIAPPRTGADVPFAAVATAVAPLVSGRTADDPLFTGAGRLVRELLDGAQLPAGGGDRVAQLSHGFAWVLDDLAQDASLLVCAPAAGELDAPSFRALAAIARRCGGAGLGVIAGVPAGDAERRTAMLTAGATAIELPGDTDGGTRPGGPAPRVPAAIRDPLADALRCAEAPPAADPAIAAALADAAARADELGAPELAISLWRRALAEEAPEPCRSGLLLALGMALDRAGDPDADAVLADAVSQAGTRDDRTAAQVACGRALAGRGRHADAVALLRRARDAAGDPPPIELEIELARHGRVVLAEREHAVATIERLLAAPEPRPPAARRLLAESALEAVSRPEPGRDAVAALARAALDGGRLLAEETADGLGWFWAAYALHLAERNGEALAVLDDAVADAQRRGSLAGFVQAIALRSGPRFHLGDLRGAAADCEIALAAGAGVHEAWLPAVRSTLVQLRTYLGDADGARRIAAEQEVAHRATGPTMLFLYGRAVLHAAAGEDADALADLRVAGRQMALGAGENPAMMPWRALAAVVLARGGHDEEARPLADREFALAERFGAAGPIAIALHARAMSEPEPAARVVLLRDAVARHAEGERRCEHIETLVSLGAALHATGAREDARAPLREALDLAHRIGAAGLGERARAALVAAGGRPRRPALRGRDALTPSELRVAELAVAGHTNREIAEALFVTLKTVEWHLTCCYRKLGVRGRTALADALRSDAASSRRPGRSGRPGSR